ncbi:Lysophospholipase, alpha-beta hydrolase superfamily [Geodermatophilus obscurus]|uniref:Lysophospholipase, alpha-beta hydrolase superfamily n=1 Tax=Geodermatophilus obscurus TaxID=1861 RepID=A0A1M7SCF8_9ACTN|nr:alpha/beta hydrolase [Geodermatophilus obscurus]SHN56160.1 Lysophospholipase, alpha-beta hydrolase superfamily [Geodermatophilus obscurus]
MTAARPGGTPRPTHSEGSLPSGQYRQAWTVEDPVGAVVLVHGAHEHGGRYRHVAERLAAAGYACHAVDHPGHGRSPGRRGNIGSMTAAVDGVAELVRFAGERHPGVPLFVYGHSLGGLIALQYLTGTPDTRVTGAVLSAAALDTSAANAVQKVVAPLLSRVLPDLGVLQLEAEAVSRDPEVVRDYRTDPLNHTGRMVARTGAELMSTALAMPRRLPSLTLPLLVLHGTADRLVPPAASEVVRAHAGSPDLTLRVYDGLFHEPHNEPEKDDVLADVVTWLDAHRTAS